MENRNEIWSNLFFLFENDDQLVRIMKKEKGQIRNG